MKIKSLKEFKLIRVAYSEQYLSKKYPSLSKYHSLILDFVSSFKKLPKKESKVKTKRFFDSLEKMSDISENSLGDLYSKVINTEFESKERTFHPKLIENLNDKESREWVQNLLDSKVELEEDIPKMVQNIKAFDSLSSDKSLSDFSSDSELFKYLSQFKQESDVDFPEELKALLEEWKLGEDEVDGHKVELYYVSRVPMGKKDSLQIIGANTNWCVSMYPNPETSYKPDEYHCFFIDGEPKVLAHIESGQIKDSHDSPLDNHLIKYINPLAQEFGITSEKAQRYNYNNEYDDEYDDEYFESDFDDYDNALARINNLEENKDNSEYMRGKINQAVTTLNYLPANETWKYMDLLYQKANGSQPVHEIEYFELSYEVLENLGNYIQVNKLETPDTLKSDVLERLEFQSSGYLKDVPSSIRKLFPEFNEGFEVLRNKDSLEKIQETEFHKTELYCEFLKRKPIKWWPMFPENVDLDLFPEVYDSLVDGFYKVLNNSPLMWTKLPKEISSDEKILELRPKVIERFKHRFTNGGLSPKSWASIPEDLRSDPEFLVYEDKVIESCQSLSWGSIPEELKSHPGLDSLKEKAKENALENLDDYLTLNFSQDLLDDDHFREKIINLCVRKLKTDPTSWTSMPFDLRSDDRIADARREGFLYKLQIYPETFSTLSRDFKLDEDMLEAQRMGYINKVRKNYTAYTKIPERLTKDKDILAARRASLLDWIEERSVWTWNVVPDELKSEPDFEALKPVVIDQMCKDLESIPGLLDSHPIPKDLLGDERLYEAVLSALIKLIHINTKHTYLVPPCMIKDERYIAEVTKVFTKKLEESPFSSIPYEYAHIRELQLAKINSMKNAVERDPSAIISVPQNLQKEPVMYEALVTGSVNLLQEHLTNWARININVKKDPRIQKFKNAVVEHYVEILGIFGKAYIPEDLKDDPRIQPLIADRQASKGFKMIRVAYSEQYLSKKYPSISKYHSLILDFVSSFKKLPKKESKVKTKKFFDSLEKMPDISSESLTELYKTVSTTDFENKERTFHPTIIENLSKLEEREWVQSLLDNKIELEEDIPKIVQHLKEFNDLDIESSLSDFKSDSELFKYLSQFRKTVEAEYPEKLKRLLESWKVDEDIVDGHKVELYYLEREEIDHRDSLQIIGEDTSWCVTNYPNPETSYKPDEYYCFFIDNKPQVLIHLDSGQIKDTSDSALNNYLIKYINPLIEKHQLRPSEDDFEDYEEEAYENDFEDYDSALEAIESVEDRLDDKDFIKGEIYDDFQVLNYLPLDETWKYMDILYSILDSPENMSSPKEVSFDVLNNLGNYIKTNSLNIPYKLKFYVVHTLQYNCNQYLKVIPPSVRKLFPEFNEGFEILRKRKKSVEDDQFYKTTLFLEMLKKNPGWCMRQFPESENLKDHPEICDALIEAFITAHKEGPYHFNWTSIPEEIRDDPKLDKVRESVIEKHVKSFSTNASNLINWNKIPTDLRNDPAFLPYRSKVVEVCKNGGGSWNSVPVDLRDDPELSEMKVEEKEHSLYLINDRLAFDEVPKDFLEDPEFEKSAFNKCIEHLERHPTNYNKLPEAFRNEDTLMATRKGYLEVLKERPDLYYKLPETIHSDSEILAALREGWIRNVRNNSANTAHLPVHLRDDPEIKKARIEGRVKLLSSSCWNWVHMKAALKETPEIQACIPSVTNDFIKSINKTENLLQNNPIPVDLLSNVDLYNAIKRAYSKLIKKDPYFWNSVHEAFKNDPDLLRDYLNGFIKLLSRDPCAPIPKELKGNEELELARVEGYKKQLREDPRNIHYVQDYLRNTPAIYEASVDGHLNLLNRDLSNWSSIPIKYHKDPRIKSYYDSVVDFYINKLREKPNHYLPDDVALDPRIKPLITDRQASNKFKLIKV